MDHYESIPELERKRWFKSVVGHSIDKSLTVDESAELARLFYTGSGDMYEQYIDKLRKRIELRERQEKFCLEASVKCSNNTNGQLILEAIVVSESEQIDGLEIVTGKVLK